MANATLEFRFDSGPTVVARNGDELARVIRSDGAYKAVTPGGDTVTTATSLHMCWIRAGSHFGVKPYDGDFRPSDKPSLATAHMRWLDRGLPASTWTDFVKSGAAENFR